VVDKTLKDHYKKCVPHLHFPEDIVCSHVGSGNLDVARAVESGIKVGKKRATLDLQCPYSLPDPTRQIILLKMIAMRISNFSKIGGLSMQVRKACERVVSEIYDYAHRNAMEVLAESAL
jgi:hypothetical protein